MYEYACHMYTVQVYFITHMVTWNHIYSTAFSYLLFCHLHLVDKYDGGIYYHKYGGKMCVMLVFILKVQWQSSHDRYKQLTC